MQHKSQAYKKYNKTMNQYKKKPYLFVEEILGVKLKSYQRLYYSLFYWLDEIEHYYHNPNRIIKKYCNLRNN